MKKLAEPPDGISLAERISEDVSTDAGRGLMEHYRAVRQFSEKLCQPLVAEDYVIQSMPDVSPAKWHLAHTSWFFETFILKPRLKNYRSPVPQYAYLFNSYYNAAGPMHCRDRRGMISRPTVEQTYQYRQHIDSEMLRLLEGCDEDQLTGLAPLVTLGLHHEQQHQELLVTDIKHVFAQNPLYPVYRPRKDFRREEVPPLDWIEFGEGLYWMGHEGSGFSYDNEGPRHRQFLERFALGSRLVTNGDYLQFIEEGGYTRPEFWLSLGWQTVRQQDWKAPLYWEKVDGQWQTFTLSGLRAVEPAEPVCHVSYFEADAFARWAGARLASEVEWEVAAAKQGADGNFVENEMFHPAPVSPESAGSSRLRQIFGDLWEWTRSAYLPYPGYQAEPGAIGEYNGKFMCGQMVLRGGSCATSRSHIRATYRNFFMPDKRWQFTGIRLARDSR